MPQKTIGIFDSGTGAISVLRHLLKKWPNHRYLYVGDTARAPWGEKSASELKEIVSEIVEFFISKNVAEIVMGSNTPIRFIPELSEATKIPIHGIIGAAADVIINTPQNQRVLVFGTTFTVQNHTYANALKRRNPNIEVEEIACPEIVPLVESGNAQSSDARKVVQKYLEEASKIKPDLIVYGCTQFPFLDPLFQEESQGTYRFIDPGKCFAEALNWEPYVQHGASTASQVQFFVSGKTEIVAGFARKYLGIQNPEISVYTPLKTKK